MRCLRFPPLVASTVNYPLPKTASQKGDSVLKDWLLIKVSYWFILAGRRLLFLNNQAATEKHFMILLYCKIIFLVYFQDLVGFTVGGGWLCWQLLHCWVSSRWESRQQRQTGSLRLEHGCVTDNKAWYNSAVYKVMSLCWQGATGSFRQHGYHNKDETMKKKPYSVCRMTQWARG